jgi:hypothetical protein
MVTHLSPHKDTNQRCPNEVVEVCRAYQNLVDVANQGCWISYLHVVHKRHRTNCVNSTLNIVTQLQCQKTQKVSWLTQLINLDGIVYKVVIFVNIIPFTFSITVYGTKYVVSGRNHSLENLDVLTALLVIDNKRVFQHFTLRQVESKLEHFKEDIAPLKRLYKDSYSRVGGVLKPNHI